MSRLLNNFISKLRASTPGTITLGFEGNRVVAVRAEKVGAGYLITHVAEVQLPFTPFSDSVPSKSDNAVLTQALSRLAETVPQTFWPLQIALPDVAAIFRIMEFDSIPETDEECSAIAQFRLERELPDIQNMCCTTQVISKPPKENLLLALFIRRAWLDCLNDACRSTGYVASVIDITASYLFNQFQDDFSSTQNDGVLILLETSTWSILFWDSQCRPRFFKSRWRDKVKSKEEEFDSIVQEIERLIVSYVLHVPGRKVVQIHLYANASDREKLAPLLDKRMRIPCIQLDVSVDFTVADNILMQDIPAGLLASAILRT